ncbi:hypothetical protein H9Q10_03260 [Eikenella sp. S3360]|uniref:Lysozyme inhibitor LprI N-terminal domain-containing protein n=1 Tax=Eikenella glucosivorans TaxID=2766967 RepID=A0ABS0N8P4_9NEIS|nr:hypothetical protein [Eikenella glucosivorans]MBH5328686.1 hypothetical protein [Eikenella glucosivorans]
MKRLLMALALLLPAAAFAKQTAGQAPCPQVNRDSIEVLTYLYACTDSDAAALPAAAEQQSDKLMQLANQCSSSDQETWWRQNGARMQAERARYEAAADVDTAAVCRQRSAHIRQILRRYR